MTVLAACDRVYGPSLCTISALKEARCTRSSTMVRFVCERFDKSKRGKVRKETLVRCLDNDVETLMYFLNSGVSLPKMSVVFYMDAFKTMMEIEFFN